MTPLLVGLLVGGKATRFGGIAKGMLSAPDTGEALATRLARLCREAHPLAEVVLVGRADAYLSLGFDSLEDDPAAAGPLGGLSTLLHEAERRGSLALAIAADLPYVTTDMVARIGLYSASAAAVAPRPSGTWQPLFARYEPGRCFPALTAAIASGRFAARAILEGLGDDAVVLPLTPAEEALLRDWDCPADVTRGE